MKITKALLNIVLLSATAITFNAVADNTITKTQYVKTQYASITYLDQQEKYLNLSIQEVQRAQMLRQRYKGFISDEITDVEFLGTYAKTDEERYKYATIFAKAYRATIAKTLAFQKAYKRASLELFGNGSMFDYKPKPQLVLSNRISYSFNPKSCDQSCSSHLMQLIKNSINKNIDLYFENSTAQEIRQWASDNAITPDSVNNRQITLNFVQ